MLDSLTTFTNLINSPHGQLVAGSVLAGIVWKFFERVEAVLNEQTKKEIGDWLLDARTAEKVRTWPDTFATVFDRVFGKLDTRRWVIPTLVSLGVFTALLMLIMGVAHKSRNCVSRV